jgi:glucose-6-phosphate isomerase
MKIDLSNLAKIDKKHGLSKNELASLSKSTTPLLKKIESRKQGFYKVIDDKKTVKKINDFAAGCVNRYADIVVLGIGGSALGVTCLKQSLKHLYENELPFGGESRSCCEEEESGGSCRGGGCGCSSGSCNGENYGGGQIYPRLHVLDNIDPVMISEIEDLIDYGTTLFIVITKSGTTPETMAEYFYFREKSDKFGLNPKNHFVFITDGKKGALREMAEKEKIPSFEIPSDVGGRFSVLTAAGLLPAKLIGIDIEGLLAGAKKMRDIFLNNKFEHNLPYRLAAAQYLLSQKGKTTNVLMPYSQKLISFADWFRQLLAESTGKNGKGITPISALGVTDQHSQSQLYNEGPNDKLIIFIKVKEMGSKVRIPNPPANTPELKFLKNTDFQTLLQTEMEGTVSSLTKNDRPNVTIEIPHLNAETLGELFILFEGATAFVCEMMKINAYDQPGVELSKKITKELLLKKK